MSWASILAGFVKLANLVMGYLNNKQLLDAGRAQASAEFSAEQQERVNAANRAAVDAREHVDAHGVPDDFYRRD